MEGGKVNSTMNLFLKLDTLPPVGPIFKDPTEGDDGYEDKPTRRKAK